MNAGPSFSALEPHLRAFTPAQAALTRLLDGMHRCGDSDDWQLQPVRTPLKAAAPITLSIESTQCHAELIVDGSHYPALHAIARDTDRPRRLALGNLWLGPVLEALEDAGLGEAQLTNLRRLKADAVGPATAPVLPLQIVNAAHACRCEIRALTWHVAPPAPPAADPAAILDRFSALALPGRLRVASRRCRRATLDTLAPGDTLLGWNGATYRPATDEGTVRLAWGDARQPHLTATAHYKDGIVTTLDLPPLADDDDAFMDDFAAPRRPAGNGADGGVPLEQLEVPVHLELAVMGMPLAELAALQPQHVLTLPVKIRDATVRLVCHGQTLGHGQLVAVGEQLGLQIASIGKHHAER
ncbi:type III secretion system cytoplasmic ring protein SctQ [Ralstonia solanacearum]|uniref:type III secretion system cytoplasmic ring protein SctQ n=1 Tax=Ralstonia solanacearum TaxID=305 RepID=UPI001FF72DF5